MYIVIITNYEHTAGCRSVVVLATPNTQKQDFDKDVSPYSCIIDCDCEIDNRSKMTIVQTKKLKSTY